MSTIELSPGIYRIALARLGEVEPAVLTRHGKDGVTILPPSVKPDPNQEWGIVRGPGGNLIIQLPFPLRPSSYLTYRGAPLKKPRQADRVEYHPSEFPPNEWHPVIAPGFRYLLRVAHSDLGITLGPELIYPPFLKLGHENQLQWHFERLRDE